MINEQTIKLNYFWKKCDSNSSINWIYASPVLNETTFLPKGKKEEEKYDSACFEQIFIQGQAEEILKKMKEQIKDVLYFGDLYLGKSKKGDCYYGILFRKQR